MAAVPPPACAGAGSRRAGYQVAAAGVSLVGFRKKDCPQKIVKNIGLRHSLKTIEKPPYSSYAPIGGRSPARRKSAMPEPVDIRKFDTRRVVSRLAVKIALCSPRKPLSSF